MFCPDCQNLIKNATAHGVIRQDQEEALLGWESNGELAIPFKGSEASKSFGPIMAIYYFGAFLILSAFGWFLTSQWKALGSGGVLAVSVGYALLFWFIGRFLARDEKFPIAGGLLTTCAVGMTPLIVYCVQDLLGLWPQNHPGAYNGYYLWINGSWIVIEMATIAVAFAALRRVKFSFLVMPAAIAFWFFSMDIAEIIFRSHHLPWDVRSWTSVFSGVPILLLGRLIDRRSEGVDYAFWIYLAGLLAFWGGLTSLPSHGEIGRIIYATLNLGLIVLGLNFGRKTFAVFGVIGIYIYIGHLAWQVFKDSLLFPVVLSFLGFFMILSAVFFQKFYHHMESALSKAPRHG